MSAKIAFSLLGQKRFWPLMGAQGFGAFNDNLFRYALISMATYQGLTVFGLDREIMLPIAASAFTIPIALFSAFAGRLADLHDRTRIMRWAKFAEIWLMLGALVAFALESALLLLLLLFLMGVQSAFFAPSRTSAIPTLLSPKELVPGNALMSGSLNVSVLLGVAMGTVLVRGDLGAETVGAVLLLVAVIGWLTMRQLPPALPQKGDDGAAAPLPLSRYRAWAQAPEGVARSGVGARAVWDLTARPAIYAALPLLVLVNETISMLWTTLRRPQVLRPLLGAAWFWMASAFIVITTIPLFTRNVLGADESVVALFSALFTVGAAVGAIACGALARDGRALSFSIAGALGLTASSVFVAVYTLDYAPANMVDAAVFLGESRNLPIVIGLVIAAMSAGLFVVPLQALAQRRADPGLRGRLLASGSILNAIAATLGQTIIVGIYLLDLPLQTAFLFIGAVSLMAAAYIGWRVATGKEAEPGDS